MSTRSRPRYQRVPVSDAEYADFCECRCSLIDGTHQALHCRLIREQQATQQAGGGR